MTESVVQIDQNRLIITYMQKQLTTLISDQNLERSLMDIKHKNQRDALRAQFAPLYAALAKNEPYASIGSHMWNVLNSVVFQGHHSDIVEEGHDHLATGYNAND